jgi:uncharacterized alpha-E superfamily protein
MWRVFDGIQKLWQNLKNEKQHTIPVLVKFFDRIITRLIAFMSLTEESILVKQGLLLYFIGLQMEEAFTTIAKFRSLIIVQHNQELEYEILESLLSSHESLNIYRYSYKSYLSVENVISLILLDKEYAKSLTYQIKRLKKDIDQLPNNTKNIFTECQENIFKTLDKIKSVTIEDLVKVDVDSNMRLQLDSLLEELSDLLHVTSLSISNTYFNHSYQQTQLINSKL